MPKSLSQVVLVNVAGGYKTVPAFPLCFCSEALRAIVTFEVLFLAWLKAIKLTSRVTSMTSNVLAPIQSGLS